MKFKQGRLPLGPSAFRTTGNTLAPAAIWACESGSTNEMTLWWICRNDLFEPGSIERMSRRFAQLVHDIGREPEGFLWKLGMMPRDSEPSASIAAGIRTRSWRHRAWSEPDEQPDTFR